jgi:replicative DNA helicase
MNHDQYDDDELGYDRNIFTPDRAVDNTIKLIEERISNPQTGIRQNLPGTGDFLVPWRASELVVVVAYTSNGKTSFINYIANQHAHHIRAIREKKPDYNHLVIYATWEQTVEEQTIVDLSRVTFIPSAKIFQGDITPEEMAKLKGIGSTTRRSLPIWLFGHSVMDDRKKKRLSIHDINNMLSWVEEEAEMKIDMIVLDYLQRIRRTARSGDLREGYMDIVDEAKSMTLRCPVVLLSQAKREVFSRKAPMPQLDDGQETSNLEQSADHFISLWMPKQKYPIGKSITWRGREYEVTDKLVMAGFLKQKMGAAPIYRQFEMEYGGTDIKECMGIVPTKTTEKAPKGKVAKVVNLNAETDDPQYFDK